MDIMVGQYLYFCKENKTKKRYEAKRSIEHMNSSIKVARRIVGI